MATGRGRRAAGLAAVVVGCAVAAAKAADPSLAALHDWQYYNNSGWRALNSGNNDRAAQAFRHAIEVLQPYQVSEGKALARSYADYAEVLYRQQRYDAADPLARWALTVRERSNMVKSETIRQNLDLLARIQLGRRRSVEAESLLSRLLALQEAALGTGDPELIATVESLAQLKADQGKTAEAERLYRRALTIRDENSARNFKEAEDLEQQAAVLKAVSSAGRGGMTGSGSMLRLNDQAQMLNTRAHAARETTADSAGTATTTERFAVVLRRSGKTDEAEELEARARTIRDAVETRAARARAAR